jgi:energy-coupling factor transporter ATP-binding protein EcfA2
MTQEILQGPGQIELNEITLVSFNKNASISLLDYFVEINLYESIFSPVVTGSILLSDSRNLSSFFPLVGDEYLFVNVKTPSLDDNYSIYKTFRIFSVENKNYVKDGSTVVYELGIMSSEGFNDVLNPIYKSFEGTPSKIINDILGIEDNTMEKNNSFTQWSILPNGVFAPAQDTIKRLNAGLYEIKFDNSLGTYVVIHQKLNADELFFLPSPEIEEVIDDIKKFWTQIQTFSTYKFAHKRGILLYGEPGCGKSSIIQLCMKHIVEDMDGIVINVKDEDDVDSYLGFIHNFRKVEPNRPLIVIMEDLDSIVGEDRYSTSRVLNVLDGIKQIENVVYIATTNYPEKLEERITDRPSRFDRRYEVQLPDAEMRMAYLKHKIPAKDFKKLDIDQWVADTEKMSIAHLRELVISTMVLGNTYEETIDRLKNLKTKPKNKKASSLGFGR